MRVDVDGDSVTIEGLVVDDPVVAGVLGAEADALARAELVGDLLEVGARIVRRQRDGEQGDLLRHEVERMESVLRRANHELVSTAGGDFAGAVQSVMVEVSQQLTMIMGRLDGALAVGAKQQELDVERERGTAKGITFEHEVRDYVEHVARIYGDYCEHVGLVAGAVSAKAGDVVVGIDAAAGPAKGTIVFEAKTGRLSRPEAMRELDRALEARGADYAILVVAGRDKVPTNAFDLYEYGGNKIICSLDDLTHNYGLECAYSLARARVLQQRTEHEGADVDEAINRLERAAQVMEDARKVKLKMTAVASAAEDAKLMVDLLVSQVRDHLDGAREALVAPKS